MHMDIVACMDLVVHVVCIDLPSEVILMREISAGVPMNDPIAPAVTPVHHNTHTHREGGR